MNLEDDFLKLGRLIKAVKIKPITGAEEIDDIIPFELFLILNLNDENISTISCSPERLVELAVGYIVNNGYVDDVSMIAMVKVCENDFNEDNFRIKVIIKAPNRRIGSEARIQQFISSGCSSIDDSITEMSLKKVDSKIEFNASRILELNTLTLKSQDYKKKYGGLHSAVLFDSKGNILNSVEDIGRHNCIDKIAGFMFLKNINSNDKIVFTTGRIGADIIYKASRMQIPVMVSNSSVTSSSALLAEKLNITVIGYARGKRFNIYSCPRRIIV